MDEKPSVGRPSKYKPEYCELLIEHMGKGFSYDSFAGLIEVHIDTLYEWEKVNPEFSEAKKIAFSKCMIFWEKLGIEHVLNETHDEENLEEGTHKKTSKSLNSVVWIFNMKNRFKWKDKQPDEVDSVNINFTLAEKMAKARSRTEKK